MLYSYNVGKTSSRKPKANLTAERLKKVQATECTYRKKVFFCSFFLECVFI